MRVLIACLFSAIACGVAWEMGLRRVRLWVFMLYWTACAAAAMVIAYW